jgi:hypothetical protein
MDQLSERIAALPTIQVGGQRYLSYQAVTDAVAAFLFPGVAPAEIGADDHRQILEQAEAVCRALGFNSVEKLVPLAAPFPAMGLYWAQRPADFVEEAAFFVEQDLIIAGPGRVAELREGRLLDARLSQLGLDEVTRQHFKIPVTASNGVIGLMHRAVASDWPNDYRGIWHDCLGMCIAGGKDISPTERLFTVIICGVGKQRYWRFTASLQHDTMGAPFLSITLADEPVAERLF